MRNHCSARPRANLVLPLCFLSAHALGGCDDPPNHADSGGLDGAPADAAPDAAASWFPPTPSPDGTYTNPAIGESFNEPSVLRASDGYYYAYASAESRDGTFVATARARDLIHWQRLDYALAGLPAWAETGYTTNPDAVEAGGSFVLFFEAGPTGDPYGSCIGVAVASTPTGPFVDHGAPLLCGAEYPRAFADPQSGAHYLIYEGGAGITAQRLTDDWQGLMPGTAPTVLMDLTLPSGPPISSPRMTYRDGWYYLFYTSGPRGGMIANSTVSVARAATPTGPFQTLADATGSADSAILRGNTEWGSPGGLEMVTDDAGQDWIVYEAISHPSSLGPTLTVLDRLVYANGWPTAPGAPSSTPQPIPVIH